MRYLISTESEEQIALFDWAEAESRRRPCLKLLFHIPNGGKRNMATAVRLKREGVKAGVPDLLLPVPREGFHGLFIEIKRVKGGKTSEAQRWWLEQLKGMGYKAAVCRGWEEAAGMIADYLDNKGQREGDR